MGLADTFEGRRLPTATVLLPTDPAGWAAAEQRCETAVRGLQVAQARQLDLHTFRDEIAAADTALAAQPTFEVTLRCLPATAWDDLVEEHPPTGEQRKQGHQWDTTTFRPALLAACVVAGEGEQPMTARQWAALADSGQIAVGELDLLFVTAVNLNARQPQVSTGKG
ncbi:MAG: hypothetical protein L0K86_11880 [Actinomycetia bacterium]|nr:hypothetical protein [Actinomycetes bacterium]